MILLGLTRVGLLTTRGEQHRPRDDRRECRDTNCADDSGGERLVKEHHACGNRQRVRQQRREAGRRQRASALEGGLEDGCPGSVQDEQAGEEGGVLDSLETAILVATSPAAKRMPEAIPHAGPPDRAREQLDAQERAGRRRGEPDATQT